MENILQVENLSVIIKERFLVKNVSFSVQSGECVAIIGEDGSGKTSLMKAITGSLPISEGTIYFNDQNITFSRQNLQNIGISLDPPVFFKYQSVLENMQYLSKLSGKSSKESILQVLEKFQLKSRIKTKVVFLSYTEKKLMALALAFLTQPKLLLLDEPFKNLPESLIKTIKKYIKDLQKQGCGIIISTKNIESVEDLSSKFIFMENREITQILNNEQCQNYLTEKEWAFITVKHPHYIGKLLIDEWGLNVKILQKKVLFEGDEKLTAQIVKSLSQKGLPIYGAGFINNKTEQILSELAPYYKREVA